jgi:hypothetical protein
MTLVSGHARQRVLITGGGSIGTNLADRLAREGAEILIFDNLSHGGSEHNYQWLRSRYRRRITLLKADVRDADSVREAVQTVDQVFHFAAQVSVTCSLDDPMTGFAVNAWGTLNVLEAIRRQPRDPFLIYTSTNKVYDSSTAMPQPCCLGMRLRLSLRIPVSQPGGVRSMARHPGRNGRPIWALSHRCRSGSAKSVPPLRRRGDAGLRLATDLRVAGRSHPTDPLVQPL